MKQLFLTLAVFVVTPFTAPAAPVPIPGSMTYTQDFDAALGTGSPVWVNDSTIPGWYAQINNGNTATGSVQAADGATALSGLLNLGAMAATDRALGSKATGVGNLANIACAVVFENTGTSPIALAQINYTGELWRTNSGTGTPVVPVNEEFTVFSAVSGSVPDNIYSGTTGASAAAGAGFTAAGAGANWTSPVNSPAGLALDGNDAANRTSVRFPVTGIRILPGQFCTLKWTDANEAGNDGFQGLDDVSVSFTALDVVLTPVATAITRDAHGTPAVPGDDSFGFTVNVSARGAGAGAGWNAATVTPPATNPASGAYEADITWTGFPAGSPKSVTFTDSGNALFTALLTVAPPAILGINSLANNNVITAGALPAPWLLDETSQTLTMTNGGGAPAKVINADAVNLSAISGAVQFSAVLDVRDTSSGFEAADTFLAQVVLNDGFSDTTVNLITAYDTDANGVLQGVELAPGGGTPAVPTLRTYALSFKIPDHIVSARLIISGNNDSANETMIVSGIRFDVPPPSLTVSAPANIVRRENGPGLADDTVSFAVTISGAGGGPSWTATGATPASGTFGPVTFTVPTTTSPAVVTVTDVSFPAASRNVSVPIPARYTIGRRYDGSTLTDIFSDVAAPPGAEWVNDPVLRTLSMTTGGTTDKIVVSDVLDLSGAATVYFSALFRARETSVGSNFETTDRFKAELILDGGPVPANTINLISAGDAGDGAAAAGGSGGPNGPPNGYLNGYSGIAVAPATALQDYNSNRARDEFNIRGGGESGETGINNTFPLSAVIPAGANSAQLRIYGSGISGSEFFTISQIVFSTVPPGTDADADGITDLAELVDGTDPHDPLSLFTVRSVAAGPDGAQVVSFPTVTRRVYRGYFSTGLATWTRDDSVPAITGDGTLKSWTLPVLPWPAGRHYLKVLTGLSASDFPPALP